MDFQVFSNWGRVKIRFDWLDFCWIVREVQFVKQCIFSNDKIGSKRKIKQK